MRRFIIIASLIGVAAGLSVGCRKKSPVRLAPKAQATNVVRTVLKPPPPKPQIEIRPGTIEYLDVKNGFRNVVFGQSETSFGDLVLKSQDDARQLKTCTRGGDELLLEGVPLEGIEYTFFKGQLCRVRLKWRIEHNDAALNIPSLSDLARFCANLYGTPKRRSADKDAAEFGWRARKVEMVLTETRLPGVRDEVKGGWAIPPTTAGQMVIESIPLRQAAEAFFASQANRRPDGL